MNKSLIPLIALTFCFSAVAQDGLFSAESSGDDTVIEPKYFELSGLEEPLFVNPNQPRSIAQMAEDLSSAPEMEFQGELAVQKEIPYTYPTISRKWLELRTLNEIEEKEAKKASK